MRAGDGCLVGRLLIVCVVLFGGVGAGQVGGEVADLRCQDVGFVLAGPAPGGVVTGCVLLCFREIRLWVRMPR